MNNLFDTERLIVRRYDPDGDAEVVHALYAHPDVIAFLSMEPSPSVDEARTWLRGVIDRYRTRPAMGGFGAWTRDGTFVGTALIKPLPGADGQWTDRIEIGWHLARDQWGQGYATELGRGLLQYGFEVLDEEVLAAVVAPDNHRSLAVARRLGMVERGLTDAYYGETLVLFERTR